LNKRFHRLSQATEELSGSSSNGGERRIHCNLRHNLTHKFVSVVERYQSSQLKYREDLRKLLVSRLLTVKVDITSDEIERLLQNHSLERHRNIIQEMVLKVSLRSLITSDFYFSDLAKGTVSETISNSLLHTTDLYHDIQRLELSINQLHQMFVQMSVLVDQQSELLMQIQYHVERSEDYLDSGNKDLTAAIAERNKKRGPLCCSCLWYLFR
jgi:t-SNARE complex subunit (syntaxin)